MSLKSLNVFKKTLIIYFLALSLLSCTSLGKTHTAPSSCLLQKTVRVELSDIIPSGSTYNKIREKLQKQILSEAVARVNGVELVSARYQSIKLKNSELDSASKEISSEKARGFVVSYAYPPDSESIEETKFGTVLNLKLDVTVCDESNIEGKIYVKVGHIDFKRFEKIPNESLRVLVESAIPDESNMVVINSSEGEELYDYLIVGQILSLSAIREDDPFKYMLGQLVGAGRGGAIVDPKVTRLSATIVLKAVNMLDNSYSVIYKTVTKKTTNALGDSLSVRIDEFLGFAIQEASSSLFEKIQLQKGFKKIINK